MYVHVKCDCVEENRSNHQYIFMHHLQRGEIVLDLMTVFLVNHFPM